MAGDHQDRLRIGVIIPAYNEAECLARLLSAMPADIVDQVVVVNDASTDTTSDVARRCGAHVIDHEDRTGPGPAIRDALDLLHARGFDAVAVMAANGKHDPAQIIDLVRPLVDEDLDLVRGSRFLSGGAQVNMPWHRLALIKVFTWLTGLAVGQRVTDATGGFQAYRLRLLDDPEINLHQPWLEQRYQVETYLFVKTLLRGYRWKEVGVNITYPEGGRYTRSGAFVDWWGYFSPVVMLGLEVGVLSRLARLLPPVERSRFVAEAQGNLAYCDRRWQRVAHLVSLALGTPRLAWMMWWREGRRGRV